MNQVAQLTQFFDRSWRDYAAITPDAKKVHDFLTIKNGEQIINDHVAYRTFDLPGISRLDLGRFFENLGYLRQEDLDFPEKKLTATYWVHSQPALPKVFISELRLKEVSSSLNDFICSLMPKKFEPVHQETFFMPNWDRPSYADYLNHYNESEYAAWTAAFGIRANHFTVLVNQLKKFKNISELNDALLNEGFRLNSSGGLIKGTPDQMLEQSSTVASQINWEFKDGIIKQIPSCYYEFAKRYPIGISNKLFEGFVPQSADKIFESTAAQK